MFKHSDRVLFMLKGGNMKIPAEVKILFKSYKVVDELNIHDEKSDLYGQINYLNQIIKLNPQAKDEHCLLYTSSKTKPKKC